MMVRQARMLTRGSVLRMCSRRSLNASSRWGVKGFMGRGRGNRESGEGGASTEGRGDTEWRARSGLARGAAGCKCLWIVVLRMFLRGCDFVGRACRGVRAEAWCGVGQGVDDQIR